MASKTMQINSNIHAKLKEISKSRQAAERHDYTMAAIIAELVLKQHKKELS